MNEKTMNDEKEQKEQDSAYNEVTCYDICERAEITFEQNGGAVFLSVCSRSRPLRKLCRRHPFVLDVLIHVADQLGVGDMLQRAESHRDVSLLVTISMHFPALAIRLFNERNDSRMFPHVHQRGGDHALMLQSGQTRYILCIITYSAHSSVIEKAAAILEDQNVKETVLELLFYGRINAYTSVKQLLRRAENDLGICFINNSMKSVMLHRLAPRGRYYESEGSELRSIVETMHAQHTRYAEQIRPVLMKVIGLMHIIPLHEIIERYVFVNDDKEQQMLQDERKKQIN